MEEQSHIFLNALTQGLTTDQALQRASPKDKQPLSMGEMIHSISHDFDMQMLSTLQSEPMPEKVRERIAKAVFVRLHVMEPFKQAIGILMRQGLWPHYGASMVHTAWQTADTIWYWAGDEATDFNHYTKRTLLLGVMAPSMVTWLQDDTESLHKTKATIEKTLSRVMQIPKLKEKALTCLRSTPFVGRFFK